MAGTGFIDSWEKVDPKTGKKAGGAPKPSPAPKKKEAPKKNVWGEDIDPNAPTPQQMREEEEAMIRAEEEEGQGGSPRPSCESTCAEASGPQGHHDTRTGACGLEPHRDGDSRSKGIEGMEGQLHPHGHSRSTKEWKDRIHPRQPH